MIIKKVSYGYFCKEKNVTFTVPRCITLVV